MSFTHRIFKLMSSKYTSSNANTCIQRIQHVHRPFLGRLCKELVIFCKQLCSCQAVKNSPASSPSSLEQTICFCRIPGIHLRVKVSYSTRNWRQLGNIISCRQTDRSQKCTQKRNTQRRVSINANGSKLAPEEDAEKFARKLNLDSSHLLELLSRLCAYITVCAGAYRCGSHSNRTAPVMFVRSTRIERN